MLTQDGWTSFYPMNEGRITEMRFVEEAYWRPGEGVRFLRPRREAWVGQPIWRGKVKLTLESTGADWESAPPVRY